MPLGNGQVFAGYTIVRQLGSGGMGEVYLAEHPRLPRRDAPKVPSQAFTTNTAYRAQLYREADLASTLWHPHIVGVHDRGETDGQLWIAMDFVDGGYRASQRNISRRHRRPAHRRHGGFAVAVDVESSETSEICETPPVRHRSHRAPCRITLQ
jgi:serine/threonine protein kinase